MLTRRPLQPAPPLYQAVSAEAYVKKASSLMASAPKGSPLELQYKTCYARVMDAKRR